MRIGAMPPFIGFRRRGAPIARTVDSTPAGVVHHNAGAVFGKSSVV
jgi:hypothetical protein